MKIIHNIINPYDDLDSLLLLLVKVLQTLHSHDYVIVAFDI